MRLLRAGLLMALLSTLLAAAVIGEYGRDRQVIRWFPGTGIAGKVDIWGPPPGAVRLENQTTGAATFAEVWPDGSFIAPLPAGSYRLQFPNDSRTISVMVPSGECVDLIFDLRIPGLVLQVPG